MRKKLFIIFNINKFQTITKFLIYFYFNQYRKYLAFVNFQCPYNSATCVGKTQVYRYGKKSDDDIPSYFIGCSAWSSGQKHTHHRLNNNEIDVTMLEKLFKGKTVSKKKLFYFKITLVYL